MTLKTIFVKSPPKAAVAKSREIQSQADQAAHAKHVALNTSEEAYLRQTVEEKARKAREAEQAKTLSSKVQQEAEIPKGMYHKTMKQLAEENPGFFKLGPDPEEPKIRKVASLATPSTASPMPVENQWYYLVNQEYYIKWANNKAWIFTDNNLTPSNLVFGANVSYNGLLLTNHLSQGRVADILLMNPSLASLLKVYKKVAVQPAEVNDANFDLTNAIPLWKE
ncbi:MAG: hypothetical protein ACLQU3_07805 [Limisphaerales bacterium]